MLIETPRGPARVDLALPPSAPRLLLVLGHGAGGGVAAPDLLAVRTAALVIGAAVTLAEQPYRVAGRRAPAPAPHLDEAWIEICRAPTQFPHLPPGLPLVTGGRSSGGRVAARTARATGAVAVLALAFPLQPPPRAGRASPPASRAGELVGAGVPVLVVNGDRDPFGIPAGSDEVEVHVVAGADHSLRRHAGEVAAVAASWLTDRLTGR